MKIIILILSILLSGCIKSNDNIKLNDDIKKSIIKIVDDGFSAKCIIIDFIKEDTLMYLRDKRKIFFVKANLLCNPIGINFIEMQYVHNRKEQAYKVYWNNGNSTKIGLWYTR